MKIQTFTTFFLLCCLSGSHLANGQRDEAFEDFLKETIIDYPNWIAENNLDPSPDLQREMNWWTADSPASYLTYFLKNLGVSGLSNAEAEVEYVSTARPMVMNTTYTVTGNITMFGDYIATGQINGESMREEGKWSVTFASIQNREWGVTYNHYSNGSLKVQSGFQLYFGFGPATNIDLPYADSSVWAEYGEELKEAFVSKFTYYFESDLWSGGNSYRDYFTSYFKEVFANTTWPPTQNDVYHV